METYPIRIGDEFDIKLNGQDRYVVVTGLNKGENSVSLDIYEDNGGLLLASYNMDLLDLSDAVFEATGEDYDFVLEGAEVDVRSEVADALDNIKKRSKCSDEDLEEALEFYMATLM